MSTANTQRLIVNYKLFDVAIYNNGICIAMPFVLVRGLSRDIILENDF